MTEWRGWLVSVDIKQAVHGQPVVELYGAWIADPDAAVADIKSSRKDTDETVSILHEASTSILRGLRAQEGRALRLAASL